MIVTLRLEAVADHLAERIERVYNAHPEGRAAEPKRTGPPARGLTWFAKRIHRSPRTLSRWIRQEVEPDPLAWRGAMDTLERLEREAGIA